LGVHDGRTFSHLLKTCPDLYLTGVDLWRQWPEMEGREAEGGNTYDRWDMDKLYLRVHAIAREFPGRARILRMKTDVACSFVADKSVDFVFIDACHLYESVKADIENWLPKIRPGGWITGHDWEHPRFPGVTKAVTEMLGEVKAFDGHVWGKPVD
jgi:hypothetical protein